MIHTQTQIDNLIELAIIQRVELRKLVESLPELRTHLSVEIERNLNEIEPAMREELQAYLLTASQSEHAILGNSLKQKIAELAVSLEDTTAQKYSVLMNERAENDRLLIKAEARIAEAAIALPSAVKEIVLDELSRFPRANQIDQLRKEFAEPASLNPRGKWQIGETYNKLDLVSINGNSFIANETTTEKPTMNSTAWTLNSSKGGVGAGITSITELTGTPSNGETLIGNGQDYVKSTLTAGNGISITNGAGSITVTATGGVNFQGSWNASTNTPTLTSSVGTTGFFYIVSVAGSTNLNGVTDWEIGDWAIFGTSTWTKVDNTDKVSSVFGRVGSVVGVSTDYSAVGITNTALGASNPSTVAATTISATSTISATGAVTGSNLSGTNTGDQTNITGNAATATALQTARNINGVSFNGTANITVTAAGSTLSDTVTIAKGGTGQITAQAALNALLPSQVGASGKNLQSDGTNVSFVADAGGTVTSVSVSTANGVSGTVATSTTTPAISLTLGAITPTSVAASGSVTGSNLSGTNTGDQTITLTGDVTGSGTGSFVTAIGSGVIVNADVNASAAIAYSKLNLATSIVNADISASAAIVDTKLATISTASKVSNSATTAASANTASAIVARDASGNFSAGTISAALTGNVTGNVSGSSGSTTGNAATATALATGRTIAITGDLAYTSPSFDGTANVTAAGTLATVATAGTTGGSTAIPVVTINAKGLTTSITTAAVIAPAGTLTGNTLASGVTASSLTSLGTIANLAVTAGTISGTPSASTDIANKLYVDTVAQGLDAKASCIAATTANITLSGTQTIDGISVIAADRVLVKNQTLSQNNGIYLCAAGAWTRTTDADTWDELTSAFTFIETGTVNADTGYVCTANAGGTLGTTALPWSQFSGAGSYTASTGLTLTGTVFSLTAPVTVALGGTNATSAGIAAFNNISGFTAAGATGTTSTNLVFSTSPTLVTPALGTPSSATLTNATGLPLTTGVTGTLPVANGGTGVTTSTGTTNVVLSGSPTITTPVIAQINDANGNETLKLTSIASAVNEVTIENASTGNAVHISATGGDASVGLHLVGKGASGYVNVQDSVDATKRIMFNAAGGTTNTRTMLSSTQTVDRTLSLPDATDTLVGRATTDTLTNKTLTSPTLTAPVLGTPASGTVTNLTGTASININGTVGATTPSTGAFTTLGATGTISRTDSTTTTTDWLVYQTGWGAPSGNKNIIWKDGTSPLGRISVSYDGTNASMRFGSLYASGYQTADSLVLTPAGAAITGTLSATAGAAVHTFSSTGTEVIAIRKSGGYSAYLATVSSTDSGLQIKNVSGTVNMLVAEGGNVGIGTTSPTDSLQIYKSGAGVYNSIRFTNPNSTADFYVGIGGSSTANSSLRNNAYIYNAAASALIFGTSDAERMRIDSSGNVGIGTASPAASSSSTATVEASGCLVVGGAINAHQTNRGVFQFGSNTTSIRSYGATSGSGIITFSQGGGSSADTERMRIDSSGNVGIGTTSPATLLHISAATAASALKLTSTTGTNSCYMAFSNTGGNAYVGRENSVGNNLGSVTLPYALALVTENAYPIEFVTNNVTRAIIDISGNLLVGTTTASASPATGVQLCNTSGTLGGVFIGHDTGTATGNYYATFNYASGLIGSITQSGTSAVLYNTTSDYRRKSNVKDLTGSGTFIDALKPRTFDWDTGDKGVGFLAHEFAEVSPLSVSGEKDAVDADGKPVYQSMQASTSEVIANLVAELQSLRKRLAALEAK